MKTILLDLLGWNRVSTVQLDDGWFEVLHVRKEWENEEYDYSNPVYQACFDCKEKAVKAHNRRLREQLVAMRGASRQSRTIHRVIG